MMESLQKRRQVLDSVENAKPLIGRHVATYIY